MALLSFLKRVPMTVLWCIWGLCLVSGTPSVLAQPSLAILSDTWVSAGRYTDLAHWYNREQAARRLVRQAQRSAIPSRYAFQGPEGSYVELALVLDDVPVYRKSLNLVESEQINVSPARRRLGLRGAGVRIGLWDAGRVFAHAEFGHRFETLENERASPHSSHATHVAGTLIAAGLDPEAMGLAPDAALASYTWDFDYLEMYQEAGQGTGASGGEHYHDGDTSRPYADEHESDCARGYACLSPVASIKNGLVVGALAADGQTLARFSSRGPTLDGRIKPDLVSVGESVYSTFNAEDYGFSSGTSMAAPMVAGAIALLLDLEEQRYGVRPYFRGSTLKALLVHTADDLGPPGPDYHYGWGRVNVGEAAALIEAHHDQGGSLIRQVTLADTLVYTYDADGGPLRVTLAWTDPVADHPNTIRDKTRPVLVHDVDLVVEQNGRVYHPYVLDPSDPAAPATTGANRRDNVEQIHLPSTAPGPLTVTLVPHHVDTAQAVSLVVTGATPDVTTSVEAADPTPEPEALSVYPNPVSRGGLVTIQADLDQPQHYAVALYDLTGRRVATVHEGYDSRIDLTYQVPATLASGTYFLQVQDVYKAKSVTVY